MLLRNNKRNRVLCYCACLVFLLSQLTFKGVKCLRFGMLFFEYPIPCQCSLEAMKGEDKKETPHTALGYDGVFFSKKLFPDFTIKNPVNEIYSFTLLGSSSPYPDVLSSRFSRKAKSNPKKPRTENTSIGLV